ncbi:MAG TPA: TIGR03118 family protein, partial [Pirellulales bacterium]
MSFHSWLQNLHFTLAQGRGQRRKPRRAATHRPRLEVLEDRTVPSGYQQTNLVGYHPGTGHFTDSNLNGWGMTSMPDGSFCVANPFSTGLATFYDRSGHVLPQTISVPASSAQPFGPIGQPAGVIYNDTSDFVISANGHSAPARLIFDSIDGVISGWNPAVDPTHAIVMVDTFGAGHPSVYTGLDMAQNSHGQNVLYAADILNNRVEMLGGGFNTIGSFTDPTATSVDAGFGAWSVSAMNDEIFVTFANPFSAISGPHGGVVDAFDTDGHLLTPNHFAANAPGTGPLENPWGITQAPANFGAYSGDLLIGNVAGAGNINVFNPITGAYLGQMRQPNGTPIAIIGLWDLEFGEGTPQSGKTNQLFFDAGPNAPGVSGYGLFGVIRAAGDQGGNGGGNGAAAFGVPAFDPGPIGAGVASLTVAAPPTKGPGDEAVSSDRIQVMAPPPAPTLTTSNPRESQRDGASPHAVVIDGAHGSLLGLESDDALWT